MERYRYNSFSFEGFPISFLFYFLLMFGEVSFRDGVVMKGFVQVDLNAP